MTVTLAVEWKRCPDGVELHDYGEAGNEAGTFSGPCFRYRSERRAEHRIEHRDHTHSIVERFVNARTAKDLVAFFAEHGLPGSTQGGGPSQEVEERIPARWRDGLRDLIEQIKGKDGRAAAAAINATIKNGRTLSLKPSLEFDSGSVAPRMVLLAENLYIFMLMELMLMAAGGVRLFTCRQCGTFFVTGPNTGKNERREYCKDKCRVAASRQRRAMECVLA